jgi:ribosomal peptide maturation radical SAM protein 1
MFDLRPDQDVYIISMPWTWIVWPPLMQGHLQQVLNRAPLKASSLSAHLHHCDRMIQQGLLRNWSEYNHWADNKLYPEWAFTSERFCGHAQDVEAVLDREVPSEDVERLRAIRALSKEFVDRLALEVVQSGTRSVIFPMDNNFYQMAGSLALSKAVKEREPGVVTILCGNICDGVSGEALVRSFAWVDAVIHGDIEGVAMEVVQALLSGTPPRSLPGTSFRSPEGTIVLGGGQRNTWDINNAVIPEYDEFFEKLDTLALGQELRESVAMPIETSRGCWWGAKRHCRFCALFGQIVYTAKTVENVLEEVRTLADRYRHHRFNAMDYILRQQDCDELLEGLTGLHSDYHFFFESKSGLSLERMIKYRDAGIRSIQVGIESFSTSILQLMDKGVTGLQNLRTLKFGAWLDLDVAWNIITGIPGEAPSDYQWMADLVKSIIHFQPGNFGRLAVVRHSPYFKAPERHGLIVGPPRPIYSVLYPATEAQLADLAQVFTYTYESGTDPDVYTEPMKEAMQHWRAVQPGAAKTLTYARLGERINIHDRRPGLNPAIYRLDKLESRIYGLALDIVDLSTIQEDPVVKAAGLSLEDVQDFCASLMEARLMVGEGTKVLGLAIPQGRPETVFGSTGHAR